MGNQEGMGGPDRIVCGSGPAIFCDGGRLGSVQISHGILENSSDEILKICIAIHKYENNPF